VAVGRGFGGGGAVGEPGLEGVLAVAQGTAGEAESGEGALASPAQDRLGADAEPRGHSAGGEEADWVRRLVRIGLHVA